MSNLHLGIIMFCSEKKWFLNQLKAELYKFATNNRDWFLIVLSLILLNTLSNYNLFCEYSYITTHESIIMTYFHSLGIIQHINGLSVLYIL